jgi:hypothetical protein
LEVGAGESDSETSRQSLTVARGKQTRFVSNPPHRFQRGRIIGKPGNEMPMNMGQLVPQQFIIDLDRLKFFPEPARHEGDFLNETGSLITRQVKEFRGMPL